MIEMVREMMSPELVKMFDKSLEAGRAALRHGKWVGPQVVFETFDGRVGISVYDERKGNPERYMAFISSAMAAMGAVRMVNVLTSVAVKVKASHEEAEAKIKRIVDNIKGNSRTHLAVYAQEGDKKYLVVYKMEKRGGVIVADEVDKEKEVSSDSAELVPISNLMPEEVLPQVVRGHVMTIFDKMNDGAFELVMVGGEEPVELVN